MHRFRLGGSTTLSAALCVVFLLALLAAMQLSAEARVAPMLVAIPALILSIMQLFADASGQSDPAPEETRDRRIDVASALWLSGIALACLLAGLVVGGATGIFAYTKLRGRQPLIYAALAAATMSGLLYFGFERALGLALFRGALFH